MKTLDASQLSKMQSSELMNLVSKVLEERILYNAMTEPKMVMQYLRAKLALEQNEHFFVVYLNNKNAVIKMESIAEGTIDGCSVYPRVVVERVLHYGANSLIFAHNHPSGNPEPSQADKNITERLKTALSYIDVRVIDHVIVGTEGCYSFAENGLL